MTKKRKKKIDAMPSKLREELLIIVQDVIALRLSWYDIISMEWLPWRRRIRKGKIRIIFCKKNGRGEIQKIDFRGDVYKWL